MTKMNEIYRCEICGNTVEMVNTGIGQMICCGKPMTQMLEKEMAENGTEKHKPVVTITENTVVKVGSIPHPMEEAHHIEWIELLDESGKITRNHLKPGEHPETSFCVTNYSIARAFCNIHGLWVNKK